MNNKPLIINLLGGSGIGKSTNAARVFYMLKEKGFEVELVTEYAKDAVWEGRKKLFQCQPYIFGKQLYKLVRLKGNVDIAVTDAPILLSALYDPEQDVDFKKYTIKKFNQFNNMNFLLNRIHPFNPNGRNENSIDEAITYDNKLEQFLADNNIKFDKVDADSKGCDVIVNEILKYINKLNRKKEY